MRRSEGMLAAAARMDRDDSRSRAASVASLPADPVDPEVFNEIVRRCHGMLPPAVYRKIYEFGEAGGLIVEVGTALGAGTTALALGLRASGRPGRVVTFDPMTGGPMRQVSDPSARAGLIRSNLQHFSVADLVEVNTDTLQAGVGSLGNGEPISVLMIDADGRIDRDLLTAAPGLRRGTKLIIDDIGDELRLTERTGSRLKVDQKMRLAYLLLAKFKRLGIISDGMLIKETYFGEVLESEPDIPLDYVLEAYRELVFGYTHWRYTERMRRSMLKWMERLAPQTLQRAQYSIETSVRRRDWLRRAQREQGRVRTWRPRRASCKLATSLPDPRYPGGACSRLRRCSRQRSFTCSRAPAPRPSDT